MKKKPVLINTSADESYSPAPKRQCKVRVVDSASKESKRAATGTACVPAIPFNSTGSSQSRLSNNREGEQKTNSKSVWKVLLDTGSEGDIVFVHPKEKEQKVIEIKTRRTPQTYRTSNGSFTCSGVGKVEMVFPDYSTSKYHVFKPDVHQLTKDDALPSYDMILGTET